MKILQIVILGLFISVAITKTSHKQTEEVSVLDDKRFSELSKPFDIPSDTIFHNAGEIAENVLTNYISSNSILQNDVDFTMSTLGLADPTNFAPRYYIFSSKKLEEAIKLLFSPYENTIGKDVAKLVTNCPKGAYASTVTFPKIEQTSITGVLVIKCDDPENIEIFLSLVQITPSKDLVEQTGLTSAQIERILLTLRYIILDEAFDELIPCAGPIVPSTGKSASVVSSAVEENASNGTDSESPIPQSESPPTGSDEEAPISQSESEPTGFYVNGSDEEGTPEESEGQD